MKHFLYMDTEILNSYISQFSDGLIVNTHTEVNDQTSTTKSENNTDPLVNTNFKISIPAILNVGVDKKDELISTTNTLTQLQSGRELIDKMFHDNAFNLFVNYLRKNNLLKQEDCSIGDYVSITSTYEFWDLDYLGTLFNENLIKYFIATDLEGYKNQFIIEKGKTPNGSDLKNREKQQNDFYAQIQTILKMCRDIMPFTKFMMINDCFVPLKTMFLREPINNIRFKYTGELTLIGRYTNNYKGVVETNNNTNFSQVFSTIDGAVNAFLKETLNIPEYSKVITPIALYFE